MYPPFQRLGFSQMASAGGDAIVGVALANTLFFAVPVGSARDKVALYLLFTMAPYSVLSPLVGPLLDRWRGSYRIAVVASAIGRGTLAIVLAERTNSLSLYPLAFGILVLSRVHSVSRSALVPDTRPPERSLMWANAWLAVASIGGAALTAPLAGLLNHFVGPEWPLWLGAFVFYAGALNGIQLPKVEAGERGDEAAARHQRDLPLLGARLVGGGLAMAASRAGVGFLTFLMAFLLRSRGETGKGFVVAVICAALGGICSSGVAPILRSRLHEPAMLLLSLVMITVSALWAAASFSVVRAGVVSGVVALATGVARLSFDSLVQLDAPESVRARTFARYETIFQGCWVGGAALASLVPFAARGGLRTLALIAAVGIGLSVNGLRSGGPPAEVAAKAEDQPSA